MRKIYKGIKSLLKGILGNLDYLAAFVLGAAAYKFAPEQLESIKLAIETFDYAGAAGSLKLAGSATIDFGVAAYDYVVALFSSDSTGLQEAVDAAA